MFKLLRSKAKFFYWIIAGSFVLFIFLAWGADYQGRRSQGPSTSDAMGSVNGLPITTREWDEVFQNYLARMRQQNPEQTLTPSQRASAAEQVWQYFLRDRVERAELARLGLTTTPEEILDVLKHNPPPELLAQYRGEDGQPDMRAYLADLANPNRDWSGVETYLMAQLPRQKLQQMIVSRAVVTDVELRDAWLRQRGRAVAEWMGALVADQPAPAEPTESEIAAYYQANSGRFERPARVAMRYVTWPKQPSEGDKAEVRQLAADVKREIESGESTFPEAAAIYSADGTKDSGGDLGTFDRNRMVAPFSEAAFSLPVGKLSDPVETPFGYHLIEVLEQIRTGGVVTSVHARHILFKVEPGDATLGALGDRADAFLASAAEAGFDQAATAAGLKVEQSGPVAAEQDIPGLPGSAAGTQFAFQAKAGQRSGVLETDAAFYVVQLDTAIPKGSAPLSEVRSQIVADVKLAKQKEQAALKLEPAVAAVRAGASFADAAARYGLAHAVTDTFTASGNIAKVGFGTAFNLVAIQSPPREIVPRVETPRGVFALRTLWKSPLPDSEFQSQREAIRAQVLGRKQYELLEAWYAERIAEAKIEDNRAAFSR